MNLFGRTSVVRGVIKLDEMPSANTDRYTIYPREFMYLSDIL
jgi:hypothetical protein